MAMVTWHLPCGCIQEFTPDQGQESRDVSWREWCEDHAPGKGMWDDDGQFSPVGSCPIHHGVWRRNVADVAWVCPECSPDEVQIVTFRGGDTGNIYLPTQTDDRVVIGNGADEIHVTVRNGSGKVRTYVGGSEVTVPSADPDRDWLGETFERLVGAGCPEYTLRDTGNGVWFIECANMTAVVPFGMVEDRDAGAIAELIPNTLKRIRDASRVSRITHVETVYDQRPPSTERIKSAAKSLAADYHRVLRADREAAGFSESFVAKVVKIGRRAAISDLERGRRPHDDTDDGPCPCWLCNLAACGRWHEPEAASRVDYGGECCKAAGYGLTTWLAGARTVKDELSGMGALIRMHWEREARGMRDRPRGTLDYVVSEMQARGVIK